MGTPCNASQFNPVLPWSSDQTLGVDSVRGAVQTVTVLQEATDLLVRVLSARWLQVRVRSKCAIELLVQDLGQPCSDSRSGPRGFAVIEPIDYPSIALHDEIGNSTRRRPRIRARSHINDDSLHRVSIAVGNGTESSSHGGVRPGAENRIAQAVHHDGEPGLREQPWQCFGSSGLDSHENPPRKSRSHAYPSFYETA